jgi:chemoreceptor zinc-binding protein
VELDHLYMDTSLDTQITKAIAAHAKWKRRLRDAIETGTSDIDTSTAGRDNVCEFGKWLHGDVPASQKGSPHHATCIKLHAQFHKAAADVLVLALRGRKDEAEQLLKTSGSPFNAASAALTREMTAWKQAA